MKHAFARVVFVVALVVQIGYAAPANVLAGLRAIACCARDCDHSRSPMDAMRCCGVHAGDQVAVRALADKELVPTFVAHEVHATTVAVEVVKPSAVLARRQTPPRDRPPPVFLLVRSLRL